MLQGLLDGGKGRGLGIIVAENSNADGIAHFVILMENLSSAERGR
jgi:hypothetical protein